MVRAGVRCGRLPALNHRVLGEVRHRSQAGIVSRRTADALGALLRGQAYGTPMLRRFQEMEGEGKVRISLLTHAELDYAIVRVGKFAPIAKDAKLNASMFPLQEYLSLAIIFIIYGLLSKLASRRGDEKAPLRNEFAISTSVSLMTISKIFADLFAAKTRSDQFILAAAVGGVAPLFFVVLERYSSWDVSSDPPKKRIWVGIVLPNLLALFILFLYYFLRYSVPSP
jgi:hypothetical protein